jgi:hypothetical protein
MHTLTTRYRRTSTDILWFREYCFSKNSFEGNNYINENFINKGLILEFKRTESDNGLTLITEITLTEDGLIQWFTDPLIIEYREALIEYNIENNIEMDGI